MLLAHRLAILSRVVGRHSRSCLTTSVVANTAPRRGLFSSTALQRCSRHQPVAAAAAAARAATRITPKPSPLAYLQLASFAAPPMDPMDVFDRELKLHHRSRAALSPRSRDYDFIRNEIGSVLLDRVSDIRDRSFSTVVNLGCGFSAENLEQMMSIPGLETVLHMSSCEALLERERQHVERLIAEEKADPTREAIYSPITHLWVKGDEELPPLLAGKIGLVLSNLSLHWVNDLPACLQRIQESLLPDGALIASMFAEDTLIELRESFAMAEQERDGGVSPHVSPFVGVADVGNLLMGAQFALPTVDTEKFAIRYRTAFELMHDLGHMGEGNAVKTRRLHVPRSTVLAAAAYYQHTFADPAFENSIPATFQIAYMIGWSPHESQQQPKRRGSAQFSLKDLGEMSVGSAPAAGGAGGANKCCGGGQHQQQQHEESGSDDGGSTRTSCDRPLNDTSNSDTTPPRS